MSQKTVLLDVSRLVWRTWSGLHPTGIDRTCLAYVRQYREQALAVVQRGGLARILNASASQALFDCLRAPAGNVRSRIARALIRGSLARPPRPRGPKGEFYLNVGHTGLSHPAHRAWVEAAGVKPIYFLHDLIPVTHPEYCRAGEADKHRLRIRATLDLGAGVIVNSQATLDDLRNFAEQEGRASIPSALVAPLGLDIPGRSLRQSYGAPMHFRSPYFVMLGTIEPRKNHLFILTLWAELARKLGSACPQLIIIGRRGWECEQVVDMLDRSEAVRGHVVELASCTDREVADLLGHARALLFPSFAEGYGLPLLEAFVRGAPVIASRLPAFVELVGDIPDYRRPVDGLGWLDLIEEYARQDSALRRAQLDRMTAWCAPRWEDHHRLVGRWLEDLSD
jgi:glycosyltransferase involved in cell wall biosynthesis